MIVSRSRLLRCCGAAPKAALRLLQRVGIETARQHFARRWDDGVVGAREARHGIEQNQHVLLVLDETLRLLDDHLGDLHVTLRRLVEGRRDDLAVDRPLHVGDLLRPLVDEQHDQVHLGMVRGHRLRDALQRIVLPVAGRRRTRAAFAIGVQRSMTRDDRFSAAVSSLSRSCGRGV